MLATLSAPVRAGLVLLSVACAGLLAGCGVNLQTSNAPVALSARKIEGNVHGGVFPIQNATVRLMETQSNGYGGVAKQLAQTLSDANGYFTFPDTGWSCDSNQFAYITVTSGHTASNGTNNNVGQIGVIGNCGQFLANQSEIDAVEVYVSELSTIAAAYALHGFITIDSSNASTGQQIINISAPANNNAPSGVCTYTAPVSCMAAGLAHGFQNAYNMVDSVNFNGQLPTGQARTSPPTNSFAYVPQAMINTLANILQSCVDSGGGSAGNNYSPGGNGSSRCGDLFYWATPPNGSAPTTTLEAALNMAQYPTNNAGNLFALQPRAVFFTPTLSQVPHDLSLSMFYLTETFGPYSGGLVNPVGLTLDSNDDAFILATSANGGANTQTAVLGLATNGAVLFAGPVSTTYLSPTGIATDSLDNIWISNNSLTAGALLKASPSTGALSLGTILPNATGVAVDNSNNVWATQNVAGLGVSTMQRFSNGNLQGGTVLPTLKGDIVTGALTNLVIDANQDVWSVVNTSSSSTAVTFANTGSLLSPTYASTMTNKDLLALSGYGIAPMSSGDVFFTVANQLSDLTLRQNYSIRTVGNFTGSSQDSAKYNAPNQAEADGAGNIFWTDFEASGEVFQYVPGTGNSQNKSNLYSLMPCYPVNGVCYVPAISNGRGMQIDSTGALWYVADASFYGTPIGVVIQTFGVGTPTWPQLSLGKPGVRPQ